MAQDAPAILADLFDRPPAAAPPRVGIVGVPPRSVIRRCNRAGAEILDLDALLVRTDIERATAYLPKVYCAILRTVVLNAISLELDAIVIDTGPGKCDGALHVAHILEEILNVPVLQTRNQDRDGVGYPLCRTAMDLKEKLLRITEGVKIADPQPAALPPCPPTAGFWGVPPRDFAILELFPPTTHVYGWTRCMENKTPADLALERHCNPDVPTVFFAQSFCAKTALAQHLARRHPQALYLDVDVTPSGSTRAKIQAFLELSGAYR